MPASRNVPLIKAIYSLTAVSMGLWENGTLSPYLLLLTRSKTDVGLVQGIMGLATVLASVPVGILSDKTARHYIAKAAAVLSLGGIASTVAGVLAVQQQIWLWWASAALWGCVVACQVNLEALYADSVVTGSRSAQYTQLQVMQMLFMALGSLGAALVLNLEGNQWTMHVLGGCILAGMACAIAPPVLMFFVHDKYTLGHESEALNAATSPEATDTGSEAATENASLGNEEAVARKQSQLSPGCSNGDAPLETATQGPPEVCESEHDRKALARTHWIPPLMLMADLTSAFASGMTVKFYPVFFMQEVHLDPCATSLLSAAVPLCIAPCTVLAQVLGKVWGRLPSVIFFRWVGVAMALVLGLFPSLWPTLWVIAPLYLTRAAAANSTTALKRSILMDYVPKSVRGRWASLDGLCAFGWSGSALLGGYLIDQHGFAVVFIITAALQFVNTIYFLAMLPLIPLHETPAPISPSGSSQDCSALEARPALNMPNSTELEAAEEEQVAEPLLPAP